MTQLSDALSLRLPDISPTAKASAPPFDVEAYEVLCAIYRQRAEEDGLLERRRAAAIIAEPFKL